MGSREGDFGGILVGDEMFVVIGDNGNWVSLDGPGVSCAPIVLVSRVLNRFVSEVTIGRLGYEAITVFLLSI